MKPVRKSGLDRFFNQRRKAARPAHQRDRADERNEGLVLLAIAFLFLANVVLYICHHYGLTSSNNPRPRFESVATAL